MGISKYKIRVFFYKTHKAVKGFYVDNIRMRPRKRRALVTVLALALITAGSVWGLGLSGEATGGKIKTSDTTIVETIINNTPLEYSGVSIHVKATGPDGKSATVGLGEIVTFTLTVNNPEDPKDVDFKFTIPPGFTYQDDASELPDSSSPDSNNTLYWTDYNAPSGDSMITLTAILNS